MRVERCTNLEALLGYRVCILLHLLRLGLVCVCVRWRHILAEIVSALTLSATILVVVIISWLWILVLGVWGERLDLLLLLLVVVWGRRERLVPRLLILP